MSVKIGSARSDERGRTTGGQAGDQTKKEVSTQNWYKHSKGWRVLRPNVPNMGKYIAKAMQSACDNNNIGYDQYQNQTLWKVASKVGYDPAKVTSAVETDCARLVRVCVQYAYEQLGFNKTVDDFYTATECSRLLKTGYFTELTGSKYTNKSDYLKTGDILCTKTKGHTVVVLNDGPKVEGSTPETTEHKLGDRILRNGCEGADVKELQVLLLQLNYDLGKWGADGDFGDATEIAVKEFQAAAKIEVDGEVGPITIKALEEALVDSSVENPQQVKIVNGNCYVREQPDKSSKSFGIARRNEIYTYLGEKSDDGWHKIDFKSNAGWVSGKYSELV